jgi:exopolyphosphatase / guanosine-5'-triphosphate,3'-diphosphate pyrophosphatase
VSYGSGFVTITKKDFKFFVRIAILDFGTNTFHLLIAELQDDATYKKLFRSKVAVKLGEGSIRKNIIGAVPFKRGLKAIRHYKEVIDQYQPDEIYSFATSAIRSAENGNDFVEAAFNQSGIKIDVISGEREAELICFGVRQCYNFPDGPALIMDIGGGSTEFIIADDRKIYWKKSFNIGAARLLDSFKVSDPLKKEEEENISNFLSSELTPLSDALKTYTVKTLVGSSGSFDTFAEMISYRVHGKNILKGKKSFQFNLREFFRLHDDLIKSTTARRNKMKGLIKMRVDMIVLASICTEIVLKSTGVKKMILSKYALKEGALWAMTRKKIAYAENPDH